MNADDYRCVFDGLDGALAILGRVSAESFQLLNVNHAWACLFGRPRADYLAQPLERVFPNRLAGQIANACHRCIDSHDAVELSVQVPLATNVGTQSWTLSPISGSNAAPDGVMLLARAAPIEALTSSSDTQLRSILEQTWDLVGHYDLTGRIRYFTASALRGSALSPSDRSGRLTTEVWSDASQAPTLQRAVLATVHTGVVQEAEHAFDLPDGERVWYRVHFAPERNADGAVVSVIAVGRDITTLKVTQEKLRKGERQYRTLVEHSPDHILRHDRELRLVYANPAAERYAGRSLQDHIGLKVGESPESRNYQVNESTDSIPAILGRVFRDGQPQEFEVRNLKPRFSGDVRYVSCIVVPERNAAGEIESVLSIGRDVTQLKAVEADLRMLNATLEERVAARTADLEIANRDLQSFAQTVSHDLRAPLHAIIGFATTLGQEADKLSEQGRGLLKRICSAGSKLNQLIDDILQYSHAGRAELVRSPVTLEQLAQEVAAELQEQYPTAMVDIAELPRVKGDSTMLRQVLQNLIGNALKFSVRRTQPRVEVNWLRQGDEVVFYVRDNGAGFDMRYADKLGIMFHRLHHEHEFPGSGVGLAIVHRLIERHGGRLWASSEVGGGATFFFTVPSAVPEVRAAGAG